MALSATKDAVALLEKFSPFRPARGPKEVWEAFDPTPRSFVDMDMSIEYNHPIPTRDGIKLRADIYLPKNASEAKKLPTVLVVTPYGKQSPFDISFIPVSRDFDPGLNGVHSSKYAIFEGSDPYFWTQHGFALVAVDSRGSFASEGAFLPFLSKLNGLDAYDAIEYLGTSVPWSNGRVGMIGASALGAVQWLAAEFQPPHLAAIMVQDALTDFYRDVAFKGGVLHRNFVEGLNEIYLAHGNAPGSLVVDIAAACEKHPYYNEFWEQHRAGIENIVCPLYLITSLADHGVHTPGSIRGYLAARSTEKFIELHPYLKWEWQLTEESLERQLAYFSKYLHGPDQRLAQSVDFWPPVRLHVTEKHYAGSWRSEYEFPLARTKRVKYFLGKGGLLQDNSFAEPHAVTYDAKAGSVRWTKTFSKPTEFTGTGRLHLVFSISTGKDADIFVTLQKRDRHGNTVYFPFHSFINDGHVAWGWLSASKRKLASHAYGDEVVHTFREEDLQPLEPGKKVELDISIQPSATLFRTGESIEIVVQGHDFNEYDPSCQVGRAGTGCNEGEHTIFLDGSYVELPFIPPKLAY